ncbi:TetR/AcrR family transcriptional regulator [Spirochaeta lutea]|uniref:TetR/AcrR family transcriptional regulator n=1 Tax=Spirochaeta lutea TaxID=1480694 RepID=UPI00068FFCAA|nr:TetR/AcrR family transcriptional regulator [Spirochaeta lutea]
MNPPSSHEPGKKQSAKKPGSARTTILETAFDLFSQRGYSGVGIQEVCTASGITKPTLYYHFTNKEGLLAAVQSLVSEPLLQELEGVARATGDVVMDIRRVIGFYRSYYQGHPREYRWFWGSIMAPSESLQRQSIEAFRKRHETLLVSFFTRLSEFHGNIRGKELNLALALPGIMNGYLFSGHDMPDSWVYQMAQHFLYGIFS